MLNVMFIMNTILVMVAVHFCIYIIKEQQWSQEDLTHLTDSYLTNFSDVSKTS